MKRAAILLLISVAAAPAWASFSSKSRGTTAAPFLTLGAGARAAGLGGAFTAASEGASGLAWNPASAASAKSFEVEIMHADWFEGASYNFASAIAPVAEGRVIGVTYQQFGVGDLARRDDAGFSIGTFAPEDMAAALSYAWASSGYLWGASAKMVRSKIVDSAETFAVDLGAQSPEVDGRRWGLAVTNVGGRLKYDATREDLPTVVSAGGVKRWGRHLVTGDIKFPRDNRPYLALGGEAGLALGGDFEGRGRLGYSSRSGGEAGSLAGFSVGAGLMARWFSLDYAFAPFGDLGSIHLFSLAVRGGGGSEP